MKIELFIYLKSMETDRQGPFDSLPQVPKSEPSQSQEPGTQSESPAGGTQSESPAGGRGFKHSSQQLLIPKYALARS